MGLLVRIPTALLITQVDNRAMLLPKPVTPCTKLLGGLMLMKSDSARCLVITSSVRKPRRPRRQHRGRLTEGHKRLQAYSDDRTQQQTNSHYQHRLVIHLRLIVGPLQRARDQQCNLRNFVSRTVNLRCKSHTSIVLCGQWSVAISG